MSGTTSSSATNGSGSFQVENGQIISPNGNVFVARGINVYDSQMGDASQILADFPGIDFIRLNVYNYQSPSAYASFVQQMTAAGVVVEFEDHTTSTGSNAGGGQGSAFGGSQLSNELNWYSSMAGTYGSNPYVWFGTDNEPPGGGLSAWEQETYNAVRGSGANNMILMELPGGGDPGQNEQSYGMDQSVYGGMYNIAIDAHFYGWSSNYSTNQSDVDSALSSIVQGAQTITSENGTLPVIIGEYGQSTNGYTTDANASEVAQAVQQAASDGETAGAAAWGWEPGPNSNLTDGQGNLTSYGQEVAQWISSNSSNNATPATSQNSTSSSTSDSTASANDTVVTAGSSNTITDASGNQWSITSDGQVAVNGSPDSTTKNVIELAYVNGTVWQENNQDLWWSKSGPTASWSPEAGTSQSPLPSSSVSQSDISAAATSTGQQFITGSNQAVDVSVGTTTVTDSGSDNTYLLPAAGNGAVEFTTDILNSGDTLNLTAALAATDWNGSASTLSSYLTVSDTSQGATVSVSSTSGGQGTTIATIDGASGLDLNTLLGSAIT